MKLRKGHASAGVTTDSNWTMAAQGWPGRDDMALRTP